jgi:hypothetical protein
VTDIRTVGGEHRVGATSAPDLLATVVGRQLTDAAVLLDRKRPSATAALLLDRDTDVNEPYRSSAAHHRGHESAP